MIIPNLTSVSYDPETGFFVWLSSVANVKQGQRAGTIMLNGGGRQYRSIMIGRQRFQEHRLAFVAMLGRWPVGDVDHISGDSLDNRWCNLREASRSENLWNKGRQRNNSSGFRGVSFDRSRGQFKARISVHCQRHDLGYFATAEAASKAYEVAARHLHGNFYRPPEAAE